jgi:hypothetical protein
MLFVFYPFYCHLYFLLLLEINFTKTSTLFVIVLLNLFSAMHSIVNVSLSPLSAPLTILSLFQIQPLQLPPQWYFGDGYSFPHPGHQLP